jgi:hypothetical protein
MVVYLMKCNTCNHVWITEELGGKENPYERLCPKILDNGIKCDSSNIISVTRIDEEFDPNDSVFTKA